MEKSFFRIFVCSLLLVFVFSSCRKNPPVLNPKADFEFTVLHPGENPLDVQFVSKSSNATRYEWDFGNGETSSVVDPLVYYKETRTFQVKLVVSNGGRKDSITKAVKIKKLNYSVRLFLITPKDRAFNIEYQNAIIRCAENLRIYYRNQVGQTFTLNYPYLDTLRGLHNYDWYNSYNGDFSGNDPRFYAYNNTLQEMQQLLGEDWNTSLYMNAVYVAAPGGGAGTKGYCAMGDQDLDGLLGKNPTDPNINRWIGGSGHEWGHGFGLSHPTDPKAPPALMGPGLYDFPNCVLLPEDKVILRQSPFFPKR